MTDLESKKRALIKVLPNILTITRIGAIPFLLILFPIDFYYTRVFCALLFMVAALTDFFDGYLARKYDNITPVGSLLDPIADKLLMSAGLIALCYEQIIPPILVGALICRDLAINGLRLVAKEQNLTISVSQFGKWKTTFLGIAIFCLMINDNERFFQIPLRTIGLTSIWIALALSLISAWLYGKAFLEKAKITPFEQS